MKFESKEIAVKSKNIHYLTGGTGEPFLLVHGWGGSSNSLLKLGEALSSKYLVIIIDLPGFGESQKPDSDWGVEEYSDLVKEFMAELGFDHFAYFGHSFGGAIGIYLAANYPELVSNLVLCAPSFRRSSEANLQIDSTVSKFKNVFRSKFPGCVRLFYKIRYPRSESMKYPELESNFRKIITQDLTEYLGKIKVETIIIWGDEDVYTPVENAEILKQNVKNSELIIIEGAGHGIPLNQPDKVYSLIAKLAKSY